MLSRHSGVLLQCQGRPCDWLWPGPRPRPLTRSFKHRSHMHAGPWLVTMLITGHLVSETVVKKGFSTQRLPLTETDLYQSCCVLQYLCTALMTVQHCKATKQLTAWALETDWLTSGACNLLAMRPGTNYSEDSIPYETVITHVSITR